MLRYSMSFILCRKLFIVLYCLAREIYWAVEFRFPWSLTETLDREEIALGVLAELCRKEFLRV